MERVRADSLGQLRHNVNNLTRGFIFVVYPSMVTCKENLSIVFFHSNLYGVKISEKNFETDTNRIRGLFIALK